MLGDARYERLLIGTAVQSTVVPDGIGPLSHPLAAVPVPVVPKKHTSRKSTGGIVGGSVAAVPVPAVPKKPHAKKSTGGVVGGSAEKKIKHE
jgi:hypothetical protein